MTYLEKVMQIRPDLSKEELVNECCPQHFAIDSEVYEKCGYDNHFDICECCWNREMPDVSDIEDSITPEKIEELKRDEFIKPIVAPVTKILDSGNRRQFETGAVRDIQEGKGRCDLMPLDVVAEYLGNSGLADIAMFQQTGNYAFLYAAVKSFTVYPDEPTMLLEVAKHFEEGCKKYGENNWQKGIPVHCYIDSAVRHYLKFLRGDKDEPHDRAFCWNIMCAIWTCKHKSELNDYAKGE